MKKKLTGMLLVFVLVICLFFVGSGVILMLAPGVEIFGIRYIGGGFGKFFQEEILSDLEGDSVYIETNDIPVHISFSQYGFSKVEFSQNFLGFTRSKYDKGGVSIYLDKDNNTHIATTEVDKWFYSQENTKDNYLNIELPRQFALNKNFYIKSNNSLVTINGDVIYQDFNIETGNALVINDSITAKNIKIHSGKSIIINEKFNATNYDLKSTGSFINITKAVEGDIIAKTSGGDVRFVSCKNLRVVTGGGSVRTYGNGLNSVLEETNIETRGGDIILGHVSAENENALCNIKSTSGDVQVTSMKDGVVSSERGKIEIGEARAVVVNSKINSVNVEVIEEQIFVNGRNGSVTLGKNGQAKNVHVYTTTGKIKVYNTYGYVNLESVSSTINLENSGSEEISLIAGKDISAIGLKGAVYIKSNGDINAAFSGITGGVDIETGTRTNEINIDACATSYLDVDYDISSTKGKIAKVYVVDDLLDSGASLSTGVHSGKNMIKVKTSYAKIVLKLAV